MASEKRPLDDTNGDVSDVRDVKKAKKDKKEKKEKKEKKSRKSVDGAEVTEVVTKEVDEDGDVTIAEATHIEKPNTVLVPFANPLASDKILKKVLKSTKRAAKAKALKRGVKECVKAINKSPTARAGAAAGIAVFAADIWPMDVISHMPVLCEDHHIPYIYVDSRAELGRASGTKRPTSVVMICKDKSKKGQADDEEGDWDETYGDLLKAVEKANKTVKV